MTSINQPFLDSYLSSELSDRLKVAHLKRFWHQRSRFRSGLVRADGESDWGLDNLLLNGLGLALEEVAAFFQEERGLAEFENWVVEVNGGSVAPVQLARINSAVLGEHKSDAVLAYLDELNAVAPPLTERDLACWQENGYTIVREAVDRDQAGRSEAAVWEVLEMDPKDNSTWYDRSSLKGIMTALYHHPSLDLNRKSLRIRKAYSQIWGTNDVWMTIDRAGFNPPETDEFRFPGPNLHWDMSLTPPFELGTHGILYLCDVAADQGAFSCIPGFHRRIAEWLESLPEGVDPREEILKHPAEPIAAEAGDLIIWHHCLPHGSSRNRGKYPRIVQYLNMYPAVLGPEKEWR